MSFQSSYEVKRQMERNPSSFGSYDSRRTQNLAAYDDDIPEEASRTGRSWLYVLIGALVVGGAATGIYFAIKSARTGTVEVTSSPVSAGSSTALLSSAPSSYSAVSSPLSFSMLSTFNSSAAISSAATSPASSAQASLGSSSASAPTSASGFQSTSAAAQRLSLKPNTALTRVFYGIAYAPSYWQPGCNATQDDIIKDLYLLGQLTTRIRVYSTDCKFPSMVFEAIKQLSL